MAKIRKGSKARQVTTHTHESVPLVPYRRYHGLGHRDFKKIPAGGKWEFPLMEGPGCVTSIWMTVAGRLIEAVRRTRVPAQRFLWINGATLTIYPNHPLKSRFKGPYFSFPCLEGKLKVYVDEEVSQQGPRMIDKPVGSHQGAQSIECTAGEDYFLSGFHYINGPFWALYHGCPVRSRPTGVVTRYRFHEAGPYPWNGRIRMTITHGEFDQVDCRMESLAFYYKRA